MLTFEQISGLLVVEVLGIPLDQGEVFTIVLRVAASALLAGARRNVVGGVQPLAGGKPGADFGVTFQTFPGRLSTELVATGAICRSVQRLMGLRERSGRDLSPRRREKHRQEQQAQSGAHRQVPKRERGTAVPSRPYIALRASLLRSQAVLTWQYALADPLQPQIIRLHLNVHPLNVLVIRSTSMIQILTDSRWRKRPVL